MSVYDERFCKKCSVAWDRTEFGDCCPDCNVEGEPSSYELDANREMGLPDDWEPA